MRLKPVRFIGHKIGPFDHIELNWEKDSRYTLIVAENGFGKTTLVAAMAACLSFGDDNSFPTSHFQRFAHDEESFAYLEVNFGKTYWILRWAPQSPAGPILSKLDPYSIYSDQADDTPKYPIWNSESGRKGPPRKNCPPQSMILLVKSSLLDWPVWQICLRLRVQSRRAVTEYRTIQHFICLVVPDQSQFICNTLSQLWSWLQFDCWLVEQML